MENELDLIAEDKEDYLKVLKTFYNDFERIILYIKYELKNIIASNNLLNKVEKEINNRLQI